MTYRMVTNMEVFVQIQLPRDARNLMDRLLCDVDDRLGSNGVQELKVQYTHANFAFKWIAPMAPLTSGCLIPTIS